MNSPFAAMSDPLLNAEITFAGKHYAARRAAELHAEDPNMSAEQIVDLLRSEADAAEAEFRRLRDLDSVGLAGIS